MKDCVQKVNYENKSTQSKKSPKVIKKTVQSFLSEDVGGAQRYLKGAMRIKLNKKNQKYLERIMLLQLLGELYGLHTLHGIIDVLGIKSSKIHQLWRKYESITILNKAFSVFDNLLSERLIALGKCGESTWSRANVCIVEDGSIFKQWLTQEEFGKCYARYFSGQTHKTEYGFHVVLIGVCIGEEFYPYRFKLIDYSQKGHLKKVSCDLLNKCASFMEGIRKKHDLVFGKIYVSVDSGFRDERFLRQCEVHGFESIVSCVKSHTFEIGQYKGNLSTYIEQVYKTKEQAYIAECERLGEDAAAFTLRVKAYYKAMKREVLLVFFRVNESKKISVVMTTDQAAKRKTIRRRFFQRVKIEQFFRFVKHVLCIQQSTSKNTLGMMRKIAVFFVKAVLLQRLTRKIRRTHEFFKKMGFERIRRQFCLSCSTDELDELFNKATFCRT